MDEDEKTEVDHPARNDSRGSEECVLPGQREPRDEPATQEEDEENVSSPHSNAKMCPLCRVRTDALGCPYSQHFRDAHPGVSQMRTILVHPRVCPHCPFQTDQENTFRVHVRKHGEDRRHQCSECEAKFVRLKQLVFHLQKKHGQEKLHACSECNRKFTQLKSLRIHQKRKHAVERQLTEKCEYCGEAFDLQHRARCERARLLFPVITETHECPECSEPFSSGQDLQSHVGTVHKGEGSENFEFFCDLCGGKYEKKFELCSHAYKAHGKIFQNVHKFNCPHCHEVSFTVQGFADHIAKHNGGASDEPREKMCPECGVPATEIDDFDEHFEDAHPDSEKEPVAVLVQPLVCPHCPFFSSNEDKHHVTRKRYFCTNCDARFLKRSERTSHLLKIHRGEKKKPSYTKESVKLKSKEEHTCSKCDSKFSVHSKLSEHLHLVHKVKQREKDKHVCSKCDSEFSTLLELHEHLREVHGEETRFCCPSCDAKFKNKRYLRDHVKTKHVQSSLVCERCGESVNDGWQLYLHQEKFHTKWGPTTSQSVH